MSILVNKRPGTRNWSGNPVNYELYSAAAAADATIYFEVKVMFKYPGEIYQELVTLPYFPYEGTADVNIQSILEGVLEYNVPTLTGTETDTYTSPLQTGYFFIVFREVNGGDTDWNNTEVEFERVVVKGGISYAKWRGNNYWIWHDANKPFLTWQRSSRQAALTERMYLAWLNETEIAAADLKARIVTTFTDGTTSTQWITLNDAVKNTVVFIPAGATQLDLPNIDPNKSIYHWEITMQDHTDPGTPVALSLSFRYYADNRMQYNDVVFNYRNSLGGLDSVMIRGVIAQELQYDGNRQVRVTRHDYFDGTKTLPQLVMNDNRETTVYKGDMGYMPLEDQQRMRDAHVTREIWWEVLTQWLPILNITDNFKLKDSDDQLWSMPIEWMLAHSPDAHYTPHAVNIGDADLNTNVCAGVVSGLGVSFPNDPDFTEIIFGATITGATSFTYQVIGFHASPITELVANLPITVTGLNAPQNYTLEVKALCANGATGAPAREPFTTAEAQADSALYNNTTFWDAFDVYVDGVVIHSTNLNPGEHDVFNGGTAGTHDVKVGYGNGTPTLAKLTCNAGIFLGTIGPVEATWDDIDIAGGFIIELS